MKTTCALTASETLTLYYYGELPSDARARFRVHAATCEACAGALADLDALGDALAGRAEAAQAPHDWSAFMRRLEAETDALDTAHAAGQAADVAGARVVDASHGGARRSRGTMLALAAMLIAGIALGLLWQRRTLNVSVSPPATGTVPALSAAADRHFDRARLVLLGLAMKDGAAANAADWEYERELAASLLPDTRLFRMAATDGGDGQLADLLGDLETVLLEASMAFGPDAPGLSRIQRLIDRRDLIVRMDLRDAARRDEAGAPVEGI